MEAGKLRHKIDIQRETITGQDAKGKQQTTWAVWASAYGSIAPISGREFEYALSFGAEVSHRVVTRYIPGLLVTDRIVFKGRVFAINAILNIEERNRELNLMCTEMVGRKP